MQRANRQAIRTFHMNTLKELQVHDHYFPNSLTIQITISIYFDSSFLWHEHGHTFVAHLHNKEFNMHL